MADAGMKIRYHYCVHALSPRVLSDKIETLMETMGVIGTRAFSMTTAR